MGKRVNLTDVIKNCEIRFDRGDSVNWKHSDFADLSRDIQRDTKVNISQSTLKRIFGKVSVEEDYIPQQTTIEALQKYGGWQFVEREDTRPDSEPTFFTIKKSSNFKNYNLNIVVAVITMLISGVLFWKFSNPARRLHAIITLKETEGLLPSTAFFDLQLPQNGDSILIDFGDKSPLF